MRVKRTWFAAPYIVWMVIFIIVPMFFIVFSAFFENGSFSLEYVRDAFSTPIYMSVLFRSIWIAFLSTAICLVLGYPVAYILSTMKKSTAAIVSMFFILPMWMNFLLRTYAWRVILDDNGILNLLLGLFGISGGEYLNKEGAILLGTVYNFLPFMILPIYTVLSKMDKSHIEAASDLGANGFTTFVKVVFPLSVPGVISGITMVFIPAITTFAISRILGGKKVAMYGDLIEEKIVSTGNMGLGSVLAIVLLILVIISMVIMNRVEKDKVENEGGMLW